MFKQLHEYWLALFKLLPIDCCNRLVCLFAAIGLLAPRLVLILAWIFNSGFVLSPFNGLALPNPVAPILGLIFLPTTTLAYCWASASFGGLSNFSGMLILAIGVIIDLGLIGNGRGLAKR